MSATSNDTQVSRAASGYTMLAVTFAVLLSMAALLAVALKLNDNGNTQPAAAASGSAAPAEAEGVKLVIKSDEEHGKKGSDGNWHDAYLPADFSIKAGATVKVTVYNYDDMPHTFTAPGLGVNATIAAGSEDKASKTTFTIDAPQEAGSYEWFCALPCDPWAMTHAGFMKGDVTVV
ncbi:MAG: cupredoxin domain-containing protein [Chloroflexota bacterium]